MRLFIMLLLLGLIGAGCSETLKGTLSVREPIVLNLNNNDGKAQTVDLDMGTHDATIKIDSRTGLRLQIADNDFVFNVPKRTPLPDVEGEVMIRTEDLGQPYDLSVTLSTVHSDGPVIEGWESCVRRHFLGSTTYDYDYDHKTGTLVKRPSIVENGFEEWGQRSVRYHDRTTTKTYFLALLRPASSETMAHIGVSRNSYARMYLEAGVCF